MVKALTYWDIRKQIKSANFDPVYLFTAEEVFLKRQIEDAIKDRLLKPAQVDFNYNVFYAEEARLDVVLDTLRTQPFLAEKRLVILKNTEKFHQHEKQLLEFLKAPILKTVFIMETNKKSTDKFLKKIAPLTKEIVFNQLKGTELNKWIGEFAKSKGRKISYNAIALLVEKIGNELDAVINALDKLLLYADKSEEIKEKDIEILIKKTRQDTRFTFLNALMSKQTNRALLMANELSRNGKHVTDLIGLINWQLKRIENLKILLSQGYTKDKISRELKMTPFVFDLVSRQAGRFSNRELERNFRLLLESDIAIKQGLKSPGLTLETLIVRLCESK